jgi:hypothetical protein
MEPGGHRSQGEPGLKGPGALVHWEQGEEGGGKDRERQG